MEIGTEGFWLEEDGSYTHCKVVGVVDAGAGLYEFANLATNEPNWFGFGEDFIPEC